MRLVAFAVLFTAPCLVARADDPPKAKAPAFTDPAKAGVDYQVQGEYRGEGEQLGKVGAQVVAEGDGQFVVRLLKGGLPGEGWDGQTEVRARAKRGDGTTSFTSEQTSGTIADGKLTVSLYGDTARLERVERKSPTEGQRPPDGAAVLFDGKSAGEWEKGRLVGGQFLNCDVTSKKRFGDFTLHLEFRTPFMPASRGQQRGNSGVYLQGRYEVQVLDSFGLPAKDNECGGIYKVATPRVNMCFPPLAWQTYDVDFTAARFDAGGKKTADAVVTVRHNGVVIHDAVKLPRATPGGPLTEEGPEPGPLFLQDHDGDPVVYRNVWVVDKRPAVGR
jgi:hypothetical protein